MCCFISENEFQEGFLVMGSNCWIIKLISHVTQFIGLAFLLLVICVEKRNKFHAKTTKLTRRSQRNDNSKTFVRKVIK